MGQGVGGFVYLSDEDENVSRVSVAGRAFFSDSYTRIKNHSAINVTSASGGSQLETCAVGRVYLRSESGNSPMWWGGTGEDAPYSGRGFPLWGGETSIPIHVTNFNAIQVVASVSGQIVYPIGFLNGEDITLPNIPPHQPDITAPFVISNSPTSGASGVALNSDITALFSEAISENSLTSGVFSLSPAHNVSFFVDGGNPAQIVMSPNVNMSGSTLYRAVITTNVTDLTGNRLSGQHFWTFSTTAAPPPPDTTPPTISGIVPVSGAASVIASTSPTVLFSEKMLSGTINTNNIFMATVSGAVSGNVPVIITLDAADQKTVTIDPNPDLTTGLTYYINVTTGVQDLAANALATAVTNHPFSTNYNFVEVYNVTGTDTFDIYGGEEERMGLVITGTCNLRNTIPKRVTVKMQKDGSPTGTVFIRIRKGTDDSIIATMGSMSAASVSSSLTDYTFTNLDNTYTVITGDRIMAEYTGGNGSNNIRLAYADSNAYTGTSFTTHDGSYTNDSGKDISFKVYR